MSGGEGPGPNSWEVFLARHGETEWNVAGRRQGQLDSPLTGNGRRHAEQLTRLVAPRGVTHIFASPLGRAADTAERVAGMLGLARATVPELAEIDHGDLAGLTNEEIERVRPGALAEREADKYRWRFPAGESYADADRRAAAALAVIAASPGVRRPLIVSHEMITRMLVRNLLHLGIEEALALQLRHGTMLCVRPGTGTIERLS